ncbi:MAG: hypothetical protein E6H08_06600 [Bacteroidetes bacterium]|jgi:hypothetical protein|nr:MAG: hypothetical protein E6H08_06600 [Bacteroidota bacterium]
MRTLLLPLKLTNVTENMISIHDYLKNSYNEKKEWLAESIAFFKDFAQMEEEFRQELLNKNEYCICLEGEMLSEKEIHSRSMEENY